MPLLKLNYLLNDSMYLNNFRLYYAPLYQVSRVSSSVINKKGKRRNTLFKESLYMVTIIDFTSGRAIAII